MIGTRMPGTASWLLSDPAVEEAPRSDTWIAGWGGLPV